jgi:hypothetical protein
VHPVQFWKRSHMTDGRFALPVAFAICKIDLLPVNAKPKGAVAISVAHNCRKLLRETPHAFRCSAMVGGLDMRPFLLAVTANYAPLIVHNGAGTLIGAEPGGDEESGRPRRAAY